MIYMMVIGLAGVLIKRHLLNPTYGIKGMYIVVIIPLIDMV